MMFFIILSSILITSFALVSVLLVFYIHHEETEVNDLTVE